ncbi:MAG: diphosphomevalonate decarboxylase [Bacteroidia bacterium]
MLLFNNKYRIPSARLYHWDYANEAMYYVTICTKNRKNYFGKIIVEPQRVAAKANQTCRNVNQTNLFRIAALQPTEIGRIAHTEWFKTIEMRPDMNEQLVEFVVMPNHIHGIIIIGRNEFNSNNPDRDAMHRVSTKKDAMHRVSTEKDAMHRVSINQFAPQSKNLASIIRGYKSAVTTYAKKNNIEFDWQPRFYDHIIRSLDDYNRISNYIMANPEKWANDKFFESEQMNTQKCKWKSPSNIALVKYWGKKGFQLPANASISFTLDNCHTITELRWKKSEQEQQIVVFFEGKRNEDFKHKVVKFFEAVSTEYPILDEFDFEIHTKNTFPHSSGIASSASGMSALALCVCTFLQEQNLLKKEFYQEASNLARIGSGSACRSVYGGVVEWGSHPEISGSSDYFGLKMNEIHPVFNTFQDTILIVHEGKKSVSSTVGHSLLNNHPFAEKRFEIANQNIVNLTNILKTGNLNEFVELVESEALMLHALMMTSNPSFILMEPNTLAIIQKIRKFRVENNCHICFTLDAGANVHILYPEKDIDMAEKLIKNELLVHCANEQYICDKVGNGPTKLEC